MSYIIEVRWSTLKGFLQGFGNIFLYFLSSGFKKLYTTVLNFFFRNYYSPGSATLYFDRHSLGMNPMDVVFDSGSTYTYTSLRSHTKQLFMR